MIDLDICFGDCEVCVNEECRKVNIKEVPDMFKLFKQHRTKRVKSNYTSQPDVLIEYVIMFKEGYVEIIKKIKGWRTDADMARGLGLTRAYICNLKKRKAACTQTVITRVASALNNTECGWWEPFEMIKVGILDPDAPQWNQEKLKGQQPYKRNSLAARFRDDEAEGYEPERREKR